MSGKLLMALIVATSTASACAQALKSPGLAYEFSSKSSKQSWPERKDDWFAKLAPYVRAERRWLLKRVTDKGPMYEEHRFIWLAGVTTHKAADIIEPTVKRYEFYRVPMLGLDWTSESFDFRGHFGPTIEIYERGDPKGGLMLEKERYLSDAEVKQLRKRHGNIAFRVVGNPFNPDHLKP